MPSRSTEEEFSHKRQRVVAVLREAGLNGTEALEELATKILQVVITYKCDWEKCSGEHPSPDNYCSMQRRYDEEMKQG